LQLDLHDQELTNDDDDIQTLTMHLIPKASAGEGPSNGHAEETDGANGTSSANTSAAKNLFEALSACADLNPDPTDEDEDGEGPDIPEPGAGGWITSENMHEFMDENGNWTGPELPVLGAGAGQVRSRDDADDDGDADGGADETKWQRTG
jgi:nucleotide-sensitive chloride channel 1A